VGKYIVYVFSIFNMLTKFVLTLG